MSMGIRLQDATQLGFPELSIPDTKGKDVKLSQVKAKLVMVFFWTASDAANKMFNLDVLVPLYNEYHSKGLEIYQVGIDNDKTNWASVVKDQQLPWINVCDGLGTQSSAVTLYNITKLPVAYFIKDGELQAQPSTGKAIAARVKSLI
jgi:peroxiredoxin